MQSLDLLIEFQDGHPRSIEQTSLFIDGVLTEVNQSEPFDQFNWDISEYTSDGEHKLIVEVEDSLGLTGQSVETSVVINVNGADQGFLGMISQNRIILAVVLVTAIGAIILLALVLRGRLQPGYLRNRRRKKKQAGTATQPVQSFTNSATESRPSWINRFQWRRSPITTKPVAQFIPLKDSNVEESQPPLAITKKRVIIGRDENSVDHVIPDASVEDVHANLVLETNGSYRLSDEGSIAGTWVNYSPVPEIGQILEHGDLVHFGRKGFKFVLRNPERVRKPVLRYEDK